MSRHLNLPANYAAIPPANSSSQNGKPTSAPGVAEKRIEIAEPVFSTMLHKSWIESYPATQHRFARLAVATRSHSGFL